MITEIRLQNFTCFDSLEFEAGEGLNVLIGGNGTGKTHVMKVGYGLLRPGTKLHRVFGGSVTSLIKEPRSTAWPQKIGDNKTLCYRAAVTTPEGKIEAVLVLEVSKTEPPLTIIKPPLNPPEYNPIFIPAKEFLSHSVGFLALYQKYTLPFDETFADIIANAQTPLLREPVPQSEQNLIDRLQKLIGGDVVMNDDGEFFLRSDIGMVAFPLEAEGRRKIGMIIRLLQNGSLAKGSVLFWDEPESNLNPEALECVAKMLVALSAMGVQCFIATHNYLMLRLLQVEVDETAATSLRFHLFDRETPNSPITYRWTENPRDLNQTSIMKANQRLFERIMDLEKIEL